MPIHPTSILFFFSHFKIPVARWADARKVQLLWQQLRNQVKYMIEKNDSIKEGVLPKTLSLLTSKLQSISRRISEFWTRRFSKSMSDLFWVFRPLFFSPRLFLLFLGDFCSLQGSWIGIIWFATNSTGLSSLMTATSFSKVSQSYSSCSIFASILRFCSYLGGKQSQPCHRRDFSYGFDKI